MDTIMYDIQFKQQAAELQAIAKRQREVRALLKQRKTSALKRTGARAIIAHRPRQA